MVRDESPSGIRIRLAAQARDEADVVLHHLLIDRRLSEQRYRETGKADPLKDLTGAGALDRAVDTTRKIIGSMQEVLREIEAEKNGVHGDNGTSAGFVVTVSPAIPIGSMHGNGNGTGNGNGNGNGEHPMNRSIAGTVK